MPDGLSLRATALLVALAFGLTFPVEALLGGGSSAATPATAQSAPEPVSDVPAAEPDLRLAAAETVPALRNPRQPRKRRVRTRERAPKPKRFAPPAREVTPKAVMPAATTQPPPTATPHYVPTPAPRYVPPAPRRTTPKPTPAAPKPTPPPSGEFDTTGDP